MASLYFHRKDLKQDLIRSSKFRAIFIHFKAPKELLRRAKSVQVKKIAHKSAHNSKNTSDPYYGGRGRPNVKKIIFGKPFLPVSLFASALDILDI